MDQNKINEMEVVDAEEIKPYNLTAYQKQCLGRLNRKGQKVSIIIPVNLGKI